MHEDVDGPAGATTGEQPPGSAVRDGHDDPGTGPGPGSGPTAGVPHPPAASPLAFEQGAGGHHARVLEALGTAIAAGDHQPGSVLRTDELEERFQVSRTVIREAIRVLESMRLVVSRRRVGVTVCPTQDWNVYDPRVIRWRLAGRDRPRQLRSLTVLRSAVEPVAARLAAHHATPTQCAELTEHAMGMVATSRGQQLDAYLVHDMAFHRVVLAASGNEMFAPLGDVVAAVLTGRTHHHVMFTDPDPAAVTLHVQVAEAVRTGDADRAESLTREITHGAMAELDVLAP